MINVLKKTVVAVGVLASATVALAQFQPNMSTDAVNAEVQAQRAAGKTPEEIASAAVQAGLSPSTVAVALVMQGVDASRVITAVTAAAGGTQFAANQVVAAVRVVVPTISDLAVQQALVQANPNLAAPTAAGPGLAGGGDTAGAGTQGIGGAGLGGGAGFGGGFGLTPTTTLGGGGGGGVSRS